MEAEFLSRYYFDPSAYDIEVLGCQLDPWMREADQLLLERRFVAIRSGNGVGKTAWEARKIIWFLNTHSMAIVPCTANSATQLEAVLWAEIYRWMQKSEYVQSKLEWSAEKVFVRGHKQAWYAIARTAMNRQGVASEALQGFHSEFLLYVVDEASGVPDKAVDALESATTTEGCYGIMCSNPTRRSGVFYRAFHQDRALWGAYHVRPENAPRMTEHFKQRMEEKYRGRNTAGYKMRVLGEFPTAESMGIVSYDEYNDPEVQVREGIAVGECVLSVDPAGSSPGADASTIGIRVGNCVVNIASFYELKQHELCAKIEEFVVEYNAREVYVDAIGIGNGVADRLLEVYDQDIADNPRIVKVNVGKSAVNNNDFYRLRSELYHRAGQAIKDKKIKILADLPYLEQDLTELHYSYEVESRKYRVESKQDFKDRNDGRSTDFGDAFSLLFCKEVLAEAEDEVCPAETALSFAKMNTDLEKIPLSLKSRLDRLEEEQVRFSSAEIVYGS